MYICSAGNDSLLLLAVCLQEMKVACGCSLDVTDGGLAAIVRLVNGDLRKALNILQVALFLMFWLVRPTMNTEWLLDQPLYLGIGGKPYTPCNSCSLLPQITYCCSFSVIGFCSFSLKNVDFSFYHICR